MRALLALVYSKYALSGWKGLSGILLPCLATNFGVTGVLPGLFEEGR